MCGSSCLQLRAAPSPARLCFLPVPQVIKEIRAITGLGLKEAKELVRGCCFVLLVLLLRSTASFCCCCCPAAPLCCCCHAMQLLGPAQPTAQVDMPAACLKALAAP